MIPSESGDADFSEGNVLRFTSKDETVSEDLSSETPCTTHLVAEYLP